MPDGTVRERMLANLAMADLSQAELERVTSTLLRIDWDQDPPPRPHLEYHQAERHLEGALLALADAVNERNAMWSAGEKFARLVLELYRDEHSRVVAKEERDAGRFSTPHVSTDAALQGERAAAEHHSAAATVIADKLAGDVPGGEARRQRSLRGGIAQLASLLTGIWSGDTERHWRSFADPLQYGHWTNDVIPNEFGTLTRAQAIRDLARQDIEATLDDEVARGRTSQAHLSATMSISSARRRALEAEEAWHRHNVAFQERRDDIEEEVLQIKQCFAGSEDFLGFRQQASALKARHIASTWHALYLAQAASEGLHLQFNYPRLTVRHPRDFEALITWARDAAKWLSSVAAQSQTSVVALSLRVAIGSSWDTLLEGTKVPFTISRTAFPSDWTHMRLQGISVVGDIEGLPLVSCTLTPPSTATLVHRLANGTAAEQPPVSQALPPYHVERILPVIEAAPPVVGEIAGFGASPLGEWHCELSATSATQVRDIIVLLRMSAWPWGRSPHQDDGH